MVERQLPKLNVAGSIPVSRSKNATQDLLPQLQSFTEQESREDIRVREPKTHLSYDDYL